MLMKIFHLCKYPAEWGGGRCIVVTGGGWPWAGVFIYNLVSRVGSLSLSLSISPSARLCVCGCLSICVPLELINSCRFLHTHSHTQRANWFSTTNVSVSLCHQSTTVISLALHEAKHHPSHPLLIAIVPPPSNTVAICFRFQSYTARQITRKADCIISRWRLHSREIIDLESY